MQQIASHNQKNGLLPPFCVQPGCASLSRNQCPKMFFPANSYYLKMSQVPSLPQEYDHLTDLVKTSSNFRQREIFHLLFPSYSIPFMYSRLIGSMDFTSILI